MFLRKSHASWLYPTENICFPKNNQNICQKMLLVCQAETADRLGPPSVDRGRRSKDVPKCARVRAQDTGGGGAAAGVELRL